MNIFSLIGHIGLLIHCGKDIQGIVQNLVQKKETFPSGEELLLLLEDAIELVGSGILSLPDDVSKKILESLQGIKAEFIPKV